MLSLKKQNLTRWIVFLPVFGILLTFAIVLSIFVSTERAEYEKALENNRIAYIKRSKAQAKERIDKLVELINENEKFLMTEAQDETKNLIDLAYSSTDNEIINKVEQIAQRTKQELNKALNEDYESVTNRFNEFSKEIRDRKDSKNYVERDIKELSQKLDQFRLEIKALKKMKNIKLNQNATSAINWEKLIFIENKFSRGK